MAMKMKPKMPLQQANVHKVPASQWRKWPDLAQRVFNATYASMLANQRMFLHPKEEGRMATPECWKTTAHNAAWTAADAVVRALDDVVLCKGYVMVPAKGGK